MSDLICIDDQDDVFVLTLNRPERRNALSKALLGELHAALTATVKRGPGAIVLCGSGGSFSAGADLTELSGTIEDLAVDDAIEAVTAAIREAPVPVIAAIDGPCMGGAFDLAIACDVRLAASTAVFQVPATRMGLLYSPKSILRLHNRLGRDGIMNLLVMGARLDAQAALGCGIVSQVVEGESCLAAAMKCAKLTRDNVGISVAATKQLLNAIEDGNYVPAAWEHTRRELMSSPERADAVARAKARLVK